MDREQTAIERIRAASEISLTVYQQPLIVTTSSEKDSSLCVALAERAGIPFEVMRNHTTADAPETVRFVREDFRHLELKGVKCIINYPVYKGTHVNVEADTAKVNAPDAACTVLLFHIERVRRRGPLYQCGFSPMGCIGCPIAGTKG